MPNTSEPSASAELIPINADLAIPASELHYHFSRSSGPGGQHVNRSETRVELLFDVTHSPSLSDVQRERITSRLANMLDGEGVLRIVASATRSQTDNRADAVTRFQSLLRAALQRRKRRIPTQPGVGARERRLTEKRTRAMIKSARRQVPSGDYE